MKACMVYKLYNLIAALNYFIKLTERLAAFHHQNIIQGVHKVFRQFKKFSTKAVDKISYIDLFYINQCLLKFLVKLKFCVSD